MSATLRSSLPAGLTGTTLAHALLVAAAVISLRRVQKPAPLVYAVDLVAAPLPVEAPRRAAAEAPPAAPEEAAATVRAKPVKPEVEKPRPQQKVEDAKPLPTKTPVTPLPGEAPSTGQAPATIKVPGFESQFRYYTDNIVAQIQRAWQIPAGASGLEAEVTFVIHRDGSVSDVEVTKRSGSYGFDLSTRSAIEAVATRKGFGPLPDAWAGDLLPVTFYFRPRR